MDFKVDIERKVCERTVRQEAAERPDAAAETELAMRLAQAVAERGGTAYFVGGCVRDRLLGIGSKDVDVEVHGVAPEVLEAILDGLGERIEIGKSFGVYGLKGFELDIAMPRMETAVGSGHKDFKIFVDPYLGTEKAAARRDFTVNSVMEKVLTGEVLDHFGGLEDLKNGVLRHVRDESFCEDPLRVLRAAQFAARYGFRVAPETMELCKTIDLRTLPMERIEQELAKALLKAQRPSVFFEVLRQMGQLAVWFPEAEALIGVPQSARHHREGDVWTHTMMVLDRAAALREEAQNRRGFMYAALCHDFGKIVTTEFCKGDYHAYNHEKLGGDLIEAFISRLTGEKTLLEYVQNMAALHMKPGRMSSDNSPIKSSNKLMDDSLCPEDLVLLSRADALGKIPEIDPEPMQRYMERRLSVYGEYMGRPYVAGKDLVEAGLTPGKEFSQLLAYAHKLRLAGVPKDEALRQVLGQARRGAGGKSSAPGEVGEPCEVEDEPCEVENEPCEVENEPCEVENELCEVKDEEGE